MTEAEILKEQGAHEARLKQLEKDKTLLFEMHNTIVVPAVSELRVLSQNNRTTTELLKEVSSEVRTIHDKHVTCEAERQTLKSIDVSNMSRVQKVSVWTVILGFMGSVLTGSVVLGYKAVLYIVKHQ
jgi:oligoribonuclease NrnB/cAMP/cGMP phosphodiesterase (DHH superfamily)